MITQVMFQDFHYFFGITSATNHLYMTLVDSPILRSAEFSLALASRDLLGSIIFTLAVWSGWLLPIFIYLFLQGGQYKISDFQKCS